MPEPTHAARRRRERAAAAAVLTIRPALGFDPVARRRSMANHPSGAAAGRRPSLTLVPDLHVR
jgi:hypothetical protein